MFLTLSPPLALIWAVMHVYMRGVSLVEVSCFVVGLAATNLSITAGYHRLFAHRAYDCRRFVKVFYLIAGAGALQHSVLSWASDHRRHHQNIDHEDDPYNIRRGFLWAHIGWLMVNDHKAPRFGNVPDLLADPWVRWQHRFYMPLAIAVSFGVPLAFGFAIGHPWGCLLWGGLIRAVVGHHCTFLVNSLAHTLGKRPYTRTVSARDSVVTALLTFGEGYHNFHHRFAADYRNGVRRHQWDPTKWLIRGMAAVGWAWNLRRAPRERIVAAQLQCDAQRLLERWRDRSDHAVAQMRERIAEVSIAVHRAAARLGSLERDWAQARASWRTQSREQLERMRAELRDARREFRAARSRWQTALAEWSMQPLPQPA